MICRADEHYTVVRSKGTGYVMALVCMSCPFKVSRNEVSGASSPSWTGKRSGQPKYNRMRAKMVKHIHLAHPSTPSGTPSVLCTIVLDT